MQDYKIIILVVVILLRKNRGLALSTPPKCALANAIVVSEIEGTLKLIVRLKVERLFEHIFHCSQSMEYLYLFASI